MLRNARNSFTAGAVGVAWAIAEIRVPGPLVKHLLQLGVAVHDGTLRGAVLRDGIKRGDGHSTPSFPGQLSISARDQYLYFLKLWWVPGGARAGTLAIDDN